MTKDEIDKAVRKAVAEVPTVRTGIGVFEHIPFGWAEVAACALLVDDGISRPRSAIDTIKVRAGILRHCLGLVVDGEVRLREVAHARAVQHG